MNDTKIATNIIVEMIKYPERFLDKDVLELLLNKYDIAKLLEEEIYIKTQDHKTIYGNLASVLAYDNLYGIKHMFKDTRMVQVEPVQSKSQEENIDFWLNLFNIDKKNIFNDISFIIEENIKSVKKRIPISLLGLIGLTDFRTYTNIRNEVNSDLTKNDILLITKHILHNKNDFSFPQIYNENSFSVATELIKNNWDSIKEFEGIDNHTIITRYLKSSLSKPYDTNSPEFLKPFITDKCLELIHKHCSMKSNLREAPYQFSYLQNLATPEKWISIIKENKSKTPALFLMNSDALELACGYRLNNIRGSTGKFLNMPPLLNKERKTSCAKEIINRLDYFAEELKKEQLSDSDKILWYTAVIYTGNPNLFAKSLSIIDFPKISKDSELLIEVHMGMKPEGTYLDNEVSDYYDLIKIHRKYILENNLVDNNNTLKKPKI